MGSKRKRCRTGSSSSKSSLYLDSNYRRSHETCFSKKNVMSEKFIDYESFPNYPIAQCFSGKNMISSFLHIKGPAPLDPVRLFYSQIHLISEEDEYFDTFIGGKTHKITPDVIASLLGLKRPSNPVPYPPPSEDELVVSKREFRRAVYQRVRDKDALNVRGEIRMTNLKPIINVLVRICHSNILPKSGTSLTDLESVYISFLLLHGYPVDLSYVIWHTMAFAGPDRRYRFVPYGIIVGRLLSYLGHPFPANTPCAEVPPPLDAKSLSQLPSDPHYFKDGPGSEPRYPSISPPDDGSELPLPNAQSAESSVSFDQGHLSETMKSMQHTLGVILSTLEQHREEFAQQREKIDHIARQQDRLAREQDRIAREQVRLSRRQARHHATKKQNVQRANPNQANAVCQECGVTGFAELLSYCNVCHVSAKHRYCLGKLVKPNEDVVWPCEECVLAASLTCRQGGIR